jgi:hypothetical protein
MGVNGALMLAWFMEPPNPERIGFWFDIYFKVFPILGVLGIAALALKKFLNLSWWIGGSLLLYVGILSIFRLNEFFHVIMFTVTLMTLLKVMLRL